MKLFHKLLIGGGLIVLLLAAGSVWLYSSLDSLVADAIRQYGSTITGVAVKVDRVKLAPAQGRGAVHGFSVGNPRGFDAPPAFRIADIDLELDAATLTADVIVIKRIAITSPDITYAVGPGGSNFDIIRRNIESNVTRMLGSEKSKSAAGKDGRKMIIDLVTLRNGRLEVRNTLAKDQKVMTTLPEIVVRDIGRQNNGATAAEVARQIWTPLQQQVLRAISERNVGAASELLKKDSGEALDSVRELVK
jgi:hypothetical protein